MSSAVIKQRTISSATETAIQMSNCLWIRPVVFPSGWTKVRFGILVHMTDSGANLTAPNFAMGFCHGTTAVPGDGSLTGCHWAGYRIRTNNWSRNSTRYETGSNIGFGIMDYSTKVGTGAYSDSGLSDGGGGQQMMIGNGAASAVADRVIISVDLTKLGGTNYGFRVFCNNNTVADVSQSEFRARMQSDNPSLTNYLYYSSVTKTVDEPTNGTFDGVTMWWDQTAAVMEICDHVFERLT